MGLTLLLVLFGLCEGFRKPFPHSRRFNAVSHSATKSMDSFITYLPSRGNPAIGNFFDNSSSEMSFIQCYMHCLGTIKGVQYGIGYPVDTPVLLTRLSTDEQELMPVTQDSPVYDDLYNHVASQMDDNEIQVYKTPVVLTMQGFFEEDDEDDEEDGENEEEGEEAEEGEDEDEGDDGEELTYVDEDDDEGLDDQGGEGEKADVDDDMSSFWGSSPAGKLNATMAAIPDITLIRGPEGAPGSEMSNVDPIALVTEDDTKSMNVAHRKADKITSEASDVSLIASFHYQKQNYHLVKLLEPIFVVGRRLEGVKGYYFSLLSNEETPKVTSVLEQLIFETQSQAKASGASAASLPSPQPKNSGDVSSSSSSASGRTRSRRRWRKPAE